MSVSIGVWRERGFSLLEVLVALTVFALLSAAAVAVLAQAADNRAVVGARMARLAEVQRARALMASDLSQAVARRVRGPNGRPARTAFLPRGEGDAGRLFALVRHGWENPGGEPRASLQFVEYRLTPRGIERATRPMLDGTAAGDGQLVLGDVDRVSLRYLYQGEWQDGWPGGAQALPQALSLEAEIGGLGPVQQFFAMPGTGQ